MYTMFIIFIIFSINQAVQRFTQIFRLIEHVTIMK